MQKLKSRIARMEKQLTPAPSAFAIVAYSAEEAEQKIKDFKHKFPGQPMPLVITVEYVSPEQRLQPR